MILKTVSEFLKANGITDLEPFYMNDGDGTTDDINYIHLAANDIPCDYDYVAVQDPERITYSSKFSRNLVGEGYFKALLNAYSHLPAELTKRRRLRLLKVEGYIGFATPDDYIFCFEKDTAYPIQKFELKYSFIR